MATYDIYKNLLGYDPREQQLQQQKLWAGLYGQAASPYEKMGIALGQLGGALFGGETPEQSRAGVLNKVLQDVGSQYSPNTPEYFKAIADALPADMANAKAYALQEAQKLEAAATKQTREDVEFITKNPNQLATELQTLTTRLENKARLAGWSGEGEVPADIQAKLEKTPEYKKIMQLSTAGQEALMDKVQTQEKKAVDLELARLGLETKDLDIRAKQLNIEKLTKEIQGIKNDVLGSRAFFEVNGLDYTKPLDKQDIPAKLKYAPGFMPALISAQKKALEGTPQAAGTANPAAAASKAEPNIQVLTADEVKAKGIQYDPSYDYAIVDGSLKKKKKK